MYAVAISDKITGEYYIYKTEHLPKIKQRGERLVYKIKSIELGVRYYPLNSYNLTIQ